MLSGKPLLYGIIERADSTYSAVFADNDESAFTLTVTDAGVTSVSRACGVPPAALFAAGQSVAPGSSTGPFH
jgi:hypothetical protein